MKTKIQIQAEKAKQAGYAYVASVVKSVYNTTYYHILPIDQVITHGWQVAPKGQYQGQTGTWYGRYGQSHLPEKCIRRDALLMSLF